MGPLCLINQRLLQSSIYEVSCIVKQQPPGS